MFSMWTAFNNNSIRTEKYMNNIFKEITINAIVFKTQLIYSTVITSK